ncbi:50S ribosomal protein L3 N(5)-glutamine methyltransferase [Biformimicrobium ophioploci]|uniref:Ribosomal protein uL3 glutamine methyltransferase n=1 Tax=Biformimicrobium ophioploci TaxID=3036711 RepID=A0ABQ6LZH7_9GAMM|nr:50S ribosomal protein L3 N(5)-glutamine methyltransferase [Microbulbifer sp. NKW57]GMG87447.1 50S ribosomal protein L3 N(5)-glutamine methyltransferase [Microbulbifer sp. NKW57]
MIEKREALTSELHTVLDFIRWGASRFNEADLWFGHGTDNAWDDAVLLVMHGLHLPVGSKPEVLSANLTMDERKSVLCLLERRFKDRVPTPYITNEAWFCEMPFYVDERVLVPRSPIAELIQTGFGPWAKGELTSVLDLCCGSGCIGIATAAQYPDVEVTLSDISADALEVARVNVDMHHLADHMMLVESDLFNNLKGASFDLILCNPPYVDADDLAQMPPEYQAEPSLALGSGDDGLDFTRRLLREAPNHLHAEGVLICEVGNSWVNLEQAFPNVPFTWIEFEHGGHGVFAITREELLAYKAFFA